MKFPLPSKSRTSDSDRARSSARGGSVFSSLPGVAVEDEDMDEELEEDSDTGDTGDADMGEFTDESTDESMDTGDVGFDSPTGLSELLEPPPDSDPWGYAEDIDSQSPDMDTDIESQSFSQDEPWMEQAGYTSPAQRCYDCRHLSGNDCTLHNSKVDIMGGCRKFEMADTSEGEGEGEGEFSSPEGGDPTDTDTDTGMGMDTDMGTDYNTDEYQDREPEEF